MSEVKAEAKAKIYFFGNFTNEFMSIIRHGVFAHLDNAVAADVVVYPVKGAFDPERLTFKKGSIYVVSPDASKLTAEQIMVLHCEHPNLFVAYSGARGVGALDTDAASTHDVYPTLTPAFEGAEVAPYVSVVDRDGVKIALPSLRPA
ncbi:MAG: hypothetical protein EBZ69_06885 [Alphaproteobacteria bacterium]|nr:hypothetical protein [Alphaproteobacteria bacterium]NDC56519.1 hypothetical protein [Alphaproteobacteria bacterium]NDG04712.1 hypothetical protein [Alphaproteobacteria bacterium]